MLVLWLTLFVLFLVFIMGIVMFFYSIYSSVEPSDSHKIDPLPENKEPPL